MTRVFYPFFITFFHVRNGQEMLVFDFRYFFCIMVRFDKGANGIE